jgi:hypothetical protein
LRATPGFGRGGYGWGRGYGWGGGWGWGGWGFGFGWPYWGLGWGFGWNPWLYNPYWYAPLAYTYYPDYSYDFYDNPPYRPDSNDNDSPTSYLNRPSSSDSSIYGDAGFNLNPAPNPDNSDSIQNSQTPQPETAPNRPAPAAQPGLVSQSQT